MAESVRQRHKSSQPATAAADGQDTETEDEFAGSTSGMSFLEIVRMLAFVIYFLISLLAIHACQLLGTPLYLFDRERYYAWMAFTKQLFGLLINAITQWFSPTVVRISADDTVANEIRLAPDGRLECQFADRAVVMANHQIYTDWLYLWWISYTNRMHGHIYIILKQSLRWLPLLGPGMMFYSFIFLARDWAKDKLRIHYRLQKLQTRTGGPESAARGLDPMWLLIFPEGTNLSDNSRRASAKWAAKTGTKDMQHQLLPRTTGLQFCLNELKQTVEWVYDCTITYEGIPRGAFGQDLFTLRSIYFQRRAPSSVNMYWRRFRVADIPLDDSNLFEKWLMDRWREKDAFIEGFMQTGRLPPNAPSAKKETRRARGAYWETAVMQNYTGEFLLIFLPAAALCVTAVLIKYWFL